MKKVSALSPALIFRNPRKRKIPNIVSHLLKLFLFLLSAPSPTIRAISACLSLYPSITCQQRPLYCEFFSGQAPFLSAPQTSSSRRPRVPAKNRRVLFLQKCSDALLFCL